MSDDVSPQGRAEAAARVAVLEEGLVLYREVPRMTPDSVRAMMERLDEVTGGQPFAFVLDMRGSGRPDAAARAELFAVTRDLVPRLIHMSAVAGKNPLLRAVLRVFAHTLGYRSVSIHVDLEEAIDAARATLGT